MNKQQDFADAKERHWSDAEVLFANGRLANADHLYGFSAECGLKFVLQRLGVLPPGRPPPKYRKHGNDIWRLFQDAVRGRDGARYLRHLPEGEPFADWHVNDRYAHRREFRQNTVALHREAALTVGRMAALAIHDDA